MILESNLKELKQLKEDKAEWCSEVSTQVDKLESDHEFTKGRSARSCVGDVSIGPMTDFRAKVDLPYIDALLHNIRNRFSGEAVNLLVSSSVFNPASPPLEETALPDYGKKEVDVLGQFYGSEATVVYDGVTFSFPPLIDKDEMFVEWCLFKRVLIQESRLVREEK